MLIPLAFTVGILVLSSTMLGAVFAWIFLLHAPENAPIPGVLLGVLLFVGWHGRRR